MQNTNVAFKNYNCPVPSNPSSEVPSHPLSNKAYSSKALGGGGDLGSWMEQARAYYNEVMSGQSPKPSDQEWQEFLSQMNWASQELQGASSDFGGSYMDPQGDYGDQGSQGPVINDFGGEQGPNGNFNYDMVSTHIGFTGKDTRNDVFGTDNSLDLDMPSAQVTTEISQDHGVSVLKVIVKTSKGTAVYIYDNYTSPDFKLDINIPDITKVTGLTGLPADLQAKIHTKKFDPNAKPEEEVHESSVTGTPVVGQDNTFYYEPDVAGGSIDFTPQGSGVTGEVTTHDVFGDSTISVKNSDKVNVELAPTQPPSDYDFLMTVTHKDGSVDVFHLHKPFKTNLNAVQEFVTFDVDGVAGADTLAPGKVPDGLKEFLTLNKTGEAGDALHEGDTVPDSTEGDTAHYNTQPDVDVHADFDDGIETHDISAPGTVVIHGSNYSDTMDVVYDATTKTWKITVTDGNDPTKKEVFTVKNLGNTKVILDTGEVTGDQASQNSVQIGINGTPGATGTDAKTQVIDQLVGLTGRSEDEVLREIITVYPEFGRYDANHDGKINRDELGKIIEDGNFPPATPDQRFMRLLYDLDPELKAATDHFRGTQDTDYWDSNEASNSDYAKVRDRIAGLLSTLYPEANVSVVGNGDNDSDDIMFNGVKYDVVNQDNFYSDNWNLLHMDDVN